MILQIRALVNRYTLFLMTNILHTAAAAAAGAAALAFFAVIYHLYDDKPHNNTKYRYHGYVADVFDYKAHAFLTFLNIIKSISAIITRDAINPKIFTAPFNAMPIWYIIRDTA